MKKILTFLSVLIVTTSILLPKQTRAQSPEKMSYQAVIRNNSDQLVINQSVGMQISILQGSTSGTAMYVETLTPTTNANGLVSIEIGGGTAVSGNFSTIDWANGPYFIKTETDPAGGTNYTITGISQLLSVPYAFHSKTAESVTGTLNETDPVFSGSEAANITATDITKLNNLSGTNTGDQDLSGLATKTQLSDSIAQVRSEIPVAADGSETKIIAGTNVTLTGSGTTASPYVVNATGTTPLSIGQSYQGGLIFWLDATGQHGLIAATVDQNTGIQWYNDTFRYTGTNGDGLYAGSMNTAMIVATQMADNQTGNFAAKVCADYSVTVAGVTYGDWYLPSKNELNLLYEQKNVIGGFDTFYYWSSTEDGNNNAWVLYFGSGMPFSISKHAKAMVRAIRAF